MSDASAPPLHAFSEALADAVASAERSMVEVHSRRLRASGFAYGPDLIVTADEALAESGPVEVVLPGGEPRPAAIVGRDPSTDVALLRVEGTGFAPLALEPRSVRAGSLAVTVGARHGAALASLGIVASAGPAWRSLRGGAIDARLELDLRLPREAEGSLVLDAGGAALGMAVFGPRRRVLVIPATTVARVADVLERRGHVPRGYLGLGLQTVAVEDGTRGAMVMSVAPDGPGAHAGVLQGDVLVAWDGGPVTDVAALLRGLGPESVGRAVVLGLRRAGGLTELTLTVGERPRG